MWKLKGCPRCGGDVFLDRDLSNWSEQCIQCGYMHELKSIDKPDKVPVGSKKQ